ncbi:MAG: hypothetical protein GC191_19400 [Azospirillum sp.]|nr:hypothetical protein [Azospirillum sp.]
MIDETDWSDFLTWHDGLPEPARAALAAAAAAWDDGAAAEAHIRTALAAAPDHLAARVGAYKFFFYKNRLAEAVPLALWCVAWAAARLGLPADWRAVQPHDAAFSELEALPRLFLFALKAYGYVLTRTGALAEGRAAVAKVAELDPGDKVGAVHLLAVIDRGGVDE